MPRREWRSIVFCAAAAVIAAGCVHAPPFPVPTTRPPIVVDGGVLTRDAGGDSVFDADDPDAADFILIATYHGHTVRLIADYGSNGSILTTSGFDSLGLAHLLTAATRVDTALGRRRPIDATDSSESQLTLRHGDTTIVYFYKEAPMGPFVDSLRIGVSLQRQHYFAYELPSEFGNAEGVVGREFLSQYDVEFDVAHRRIRIYERSLPLPGLRPAWLPDGFDRRKCIPIEISDHLAMLTSTDQRAAAVVTPELLLGWGVFPNRSVFLSHSTGMICISREFSP